mgnify:CR=1 FL=1
MSILKSIDSAKEKLRAQFQEKRKVITGFVRRISSGEYIEPGELLKSLDTEEDLEALGSEVLRIQAIREKARLAAQLDDFVDLKEKVKAQWDKDEAEIVAEIKEIKKRRGRLRPKYVEANQKVREATDAKRDLMALLDDEKTEEFEAVSRNIGKARAQVESCEQTISEPSRKLHESQGKAKALAKDVRDSEQYLKSSGPFRKEDEAELKAALADKKSELKALESITADSIVKDCKRQLKATQKELKSLEREESVLMENVLRL